MSTPHSDALFVKTYPAETTEAFCDGHVAAFAFFGGVPASILYDNTSIAVAKILGGEPSRRHAFETDGEHPQAHPGLLGVAVALSVRRPVRASGQGERQGQR